MVQQMKNASNLLKDAINDAKHLYERVNEDFFKQAEDVKSVTHDAKSTVEDAKSDLQQIGEKVKDATSEISKEKMTPDEKQNLSVKEHISLFTKKEMLTVSQMNEGTTKDMNKIEETVDNLGTEKKSNFAEF